MMTPTNDRKSREVYAALTVTVFVIVIAMLSMVGLFRLADDLGPQIGDIVSFPPTRIPSIGTASVAVSPAAPSSNRPCILDVNVMQKFGGSLVIEATQRKPDRSFRVHWAGGRTSNGLDDCGGSADLLLNRVQITALIFAAGGTGVKAER
jgi:hypothetical protein